MAIQTMTTAAARIGKLKGDILKHAMPMEVLCKTGLQKKMPKNSSDTVLYRRASSRFELHQHHHRFAFCKFLIVPLNAL